MRSKDSRPVWGEGAGKVPSWQLADALLYVMSGSEGAGFRQRNPATQHLLANMRQAVERWLHTTHSRLRRLPVLAAKAEASPTPPHREQAFRRNGSERAARVDSQMRWKARYDEVQRRHRAGEPLMAIARAMGLARSTVRKFAYAESFPARLPRGPGPSKLDPFLSHLERRLAEGCENGVALWRELRGLGYPNGSKQVHRWLAERRAVPAKVGRRRKESLDDIRSAAARDKGPPLPLHGSLPGCWSSPLQH